MNDISKSYLVWTMFFGNFLFLNFNFVIIIYSNDVHWDYVCIQFLKTYLGEHIWFACLFMCLSSTDNTRNTSNKRTLQ